METEEEKKKKLEKRFNSSNEWDALTMLCSTDYTTEEKKYLIYHCQNRLNQMDPEIYLQTIRQINKELCEACESYLNSTLPLLSVKQIEKLLYVNKYFHKVSEISKWLMKQEWFQERQEKEYKNFFVAFELENELQKESVDKNKLIDLETKILTLLKTMNGVPELFDMTIKNYLSLLEKYYPEYLECFKRHGYEIINEHIENNRELTFNMIIFDCGMTKIELGTNVDHFEFYKEKEGPTAYAHAGTVRINLNAIEQIYQMYQNKKFGTQLIFFMIGHETDHVFCERYQSKNNKKDLKEELKVFNSRLSLALQDLETKEFYSEYHDCFSHEYSANIKGIEMLYQKQKYLPSITKKEKEEANKLLAEYLLYSYCFVEECGYVGPVEFTRMRFKRHERNLPKYLFHLSLNKQKDLPEELEMVEKNLSEDDKFMLGYHNQYIGILELIVDGKLNSENLFEDLPTLYNKYGELVKSKYPPYRPNDNIVKK